MGEHDSNIYDVTYWIANMCPVFQIQNCFHLIDIMQWFMLVKAKWRVELGAINADITCRHMTCFGMFVSYCTEPSRY